MNTPHLTKPLAACALLLLLTASVTAQISIGIPTLSRVIPEVASPGDRIIFEGSDLLAITGVDFTATVGGFAGVQTITVTPLLVTQNRVEALVPMFNSFVPPNIPSGGSSPMGTVRLTESNGLMSGTTPFVYLEATFGQMMTVGQGTTLSTGSGRAVVSMDLAGGPPLPGNANFVLEIENAPANTFAIAAVGAPATSPLILVGDGQLMVEQVNPQPFIFPVTLTDATGTASVPIPIPGPGPFGVTAVFQWVVLDGGSPLLVGLSNALQVNL